MDAPNQQAAHSVMWEQSFMSAQPSPIMEPPRLKVLDPLYNEDSAIKSLMAVLVRGGRDRRKRRKNRGRRRERTFFLCIPYVRI